MDDLDALSREVAAASDAWMVPGVELIDLDGLPRRLVEHNTAFGMVFAVRMNESLRAYHRNPAMRPNLADPVTVNALLGATGNAWQGVCGGVVWMACVDNADMVSCVDRTEAIARAWIAAHKGDKQ